MKKLLGIIVFGWLLSGNAYSEIINLKCTNASFNTPLSVVIDTKNENVSYQGSNPDDYYLENGVFYFSMKSKESEFRWGYSLNRNTGILTIKGYEFSEEKSAEIKAEVALEMILAGKTTDDKSYLVKLIIDKYNEGEPLETFYLECEKVKPKF